jgi:hypothetical protein
LNIVEHHSNIVEHHSNIDHDVRESFAKIRKYRDIVKAEVGSQLSKSKVLTYRLSRKVPETIAIDGSYAPLYRNTSLWLVAVRAVALRYNFTPEGPTYDLSQCQINEGAELVTTSKRIAQELSSFALELTERTAARRAEAPRRMAGYARILREFQLASSIAEKCKDSIILMDGTLTTPPIPSINQVAEQTVRRCSENRNALVGVSKDSNANLFGSIATDEELLRTIDTRELLYVRPPEPKRSSIGPRGEIFYAKLHPDAPKWFRVDAVSAYLEPEELLGSIAQFARNQLCPGYPFPLAEAHLMAVELRKYPKLYDDLLFKVGQEMGLGLEEIAWGRTNIEGRRMDAFHAYLDLLARRGIGR